MGIDIQFTIIDGALSAGSQPRSTPATSVHAAKTTANTPMPAAAALTMRTRWVPDM